MFGRGRNASLSEPGVKVLQSLMSEVEPRLEQAVYADSIYGGPEGLSLRASVCGFASHVLAEYLRSQRQIAAHVVSTRLPLDFQSVKATVSRRIQEHAYVRVGDTMIDPTYTQFLSFVGLTPELADIDADARALYPEARIAVIEAGTGRIFGDQFAGYALSIAPRVMERRKKLAAEGCGGVFVDSYGVAETARALSGIWSGPCKNIRPDRRITVQNAVIQMTAVN